MLFPSRAQPTYEKSLFWRCKKRTSSWFTRLAEKIPGRWEVNLKKLSLYCQKIGCMTKEAKIKTEKEINPWHLPFRNSIFPDVTIFAFRFISKKIRYYYHTLSLLENVKIRSHKSHRTCAWFHFEEETLGSQSMNLRLRDNFDAANLRGELHSHSIH